MGKVELMQEKIAEQRKIPNELKQKLDIMTLRNLLISIVIMIYMIAVNLLFINESEEVFSRSIKTSAITLAVLDIILFEISYKKESITLTVHAIELLCFSLFILSIPYVYFYMNPVIRSILMLSSIFLAIYYVAKSMVIHIVESNRYRNNLSDVLEILQDDSENESYLDEYDLSKEEIVSEVEEMKEKIKIEKDILKASKNSSNKKGEKDD